MKTPIRFVFGSWSRIGVLTLAALLFGQAVSAAAPANPLQAEAQAALKQNQFDRAHDLYRQLLAELPASADRQAQADLLFYLGLTRQHAAAGTADAREKERQLAEAVRYYQQAAQRNPNSAATLNNLAKVYAEQGQNELAAETFKQAIALPDARQLLYTRNYADLLLAQGKWRAACGYYALVAWEQPGNDAVHQQLVTLCLQHDRELLCSYLWEMAQQGQLLQAQHLALRALADRQLDRYLKPEVLAILAFSLARQNYAPAEFPLPAIRQPLQALADDAAVGQGVAELQRLHEGKRLQPDHYSWWRFRMELGTAAPRGLWPTDAFRELIQSLAARSRAAERRELAERYLLLAVELHPEMVAPEALTRLADFYASQNRQADLQTAMDRFERRLYEGKGSAYEAGQFDRIYEYHTALGSIYAHLGRWGNERQVNSAIFQFDHALKAAEASTTRATRRGPVEVSPQLVNRLAEGYEKTDRLDQALNVRLTQTEAFLKANQREAAQECVAPLEKRGLPAGVKPEDQRRFDRIKVQIQRPPEAVRPTDIRLAPVGQSVRDARQVQSLSDRERRELETAVGNLLRRPAKAEMRQTQQLRVLSTQQAPATVKQIEVDGTQGRILLEKNSQILQVPFTIKQPATQALDRARFVRP